VELSPELENEVEQTLSTLEGVLLPNDLWQRVARLLRDLEPAVASGNESGVRGALIPLAQMVFEAKVGGRSIKARPEASVVIPTKSTPILPLVGAICAAVLLLLAWMLGGGLILLATGALAALVMVVAISGTRSRHLKPAKEPDGAAQMAPPVPAPPKVSASLGKIRTIIDK